MNQTYLELLEACQQLNADYDLGDSDEQVRQFLTTLPQVTALGGPYDLPEEMLGEINEALDTLRMLSRFLLLAVALLVRHEPGALAELRRVCAMADRSGNGGD